MELNRQKENNEVGRELLAASHLQDLNVAVQTFPHPKVLGQAHHGEVGLLVGVQYAQVLKRLDRILQRQHAAALHWGKTYADYFLRQKWCTTNNSISWSWCGGGVGGAFSDPQQPEVRIKKYAN